MQLAGCSVRFSPSDPKKNILKDSLACADDLNRGEAVRRNCVHWYVVLGWIGGGLKTATTKAGCGEILEI